MPIKYDLEEVLQHVPVSQLSYSEWTEVGMALKAEGYTVQVWDRWSQADRRYKSMECYKKWDTFKSEGVGGGSIVAIARAHGYDPYQAIEAAGMETLDWNDRIGVDKPMVDPAFLSPEEVRSMGGSGTQQLIRYLDTLFNPDDIVGYVTKVYNFEGVKKPSKGIFSRTAGELIASLEKYPEDITNTIGTVDPEAGAWIRFNPLDGKGVSNENVTAYRYALVEADEGDLEQQLATIKALNLPAAVIMYSGGKSIHAIVHIDAPNQTEYQKRVNYLYEICGNNGLKVDTQNKNPSRLSRMPGVKRKDKEQFLIELNFGPESWLSWVDYMEAKEDENWPEPENAFDHADEDLSQEAQIIEGVLYQSRKMLLAGESKGGKTFAAMQLAYSVVIGREWFGCKCKQGPVLYINTEMHRNDFMRRQRAIEKALGIKKDQLKDLDVVHTLKCNRPLSKGFAAYITRLAKKKKYDLVIIDPIYKVLEGDESDAAATLAFCTELDKMVDNLGTAVVYVHHFTKGAQGQKKAIDRASGSGVFARDADVVATITTLEKDASITAYLEKNLTKIWPDYRGDADAAVEAIVPTRVEMSLRAFAKPQPTNYWFKYPMHYAEDPKAGVLKDAKIAGSASPGEAQKAKTLENVQLLEEAYDAAKNDGPVYLKSMAEVFDKRPDTIKNWVSKSERLRLVKENEDDLRSRVLIEEYKLL